MTIRRLIAGALAPAALALGAGGCNGDGSGDGGAPEPAGRPNVVVITTDDQTLSQFTEDVMPATYRFFSERGAIFSQAVASPPLCCPSRAGFLTGQYAHNHAVLTNDNGYHYLRDKANTLPVWLDRAGYRTGLVGKYLNGFPALGEFLPPGWNRFFAAGGELDYRGFAAGVNGEVREYGENTYSTDLDTKQALRFIDGGEQSEDPFFLWLTYNAPHTIPDGEVPCEGHRAQPRAATDLEDFADAPLPGGAALAEHDVSDKGRWVRSQARGTAADRDAIELSWRCALASLGPVDEGIDRIVQDLDETGELDRTIIVFTSDNGLFYGEHGVPEEKELPYEQALRVPLAVFVPDGVGPEPPDEIGALVSNVDLAPTLIDYAGAEPCPANGDCRTIDGRSLRPLLDGEDPGWAHGREIPLKLLDNFSYRALRSDRYLYMELEGDPIGELPEPEIELYDLRRDPDELENLGPDDPVAGQLGEHLDELMTCAGTHGGHACP